MSQKTSIEGVVERVVFANPDTGWSVLRLRSRDRGEVTAVGNLLGVNPGETLRLSGRIENDRRFGEQLRVESYQAVEPATFLGIERYLGSGLVAGIGKTMAKRLVRHFGLATLEVIDREPERLTEVDGIGPKRSAGIRDAWREQRAIRDVMVFLQGHGVSGAHAVKIFRRYGDQAIARVRENPFRLAADVRGIGFRTADRIAAELGMPRDSPHRARAGVLHVLSQAADGGHVFLPRDRLVEAAADLLDRPPGDAAAAIDHLAAGNATEPPPIWIEARSGRADAVFPSGLAAAERGLAERLRTLTAQGDLPLSIDVARAIAWYERRVEITLAVGQRQALERSLTDKVVIITGGPGTGKTTLVRGLVEILSRKRQKVLLAAPTGRAARRLAEATGSDARTVHRLLEIDPKHGGFVRKRDNPLNADTVVVDEASMLDTALAWRLLEAVPDAARLILVGDVDQLPSVGPGRVLADLIDSGALAVARLDEVHRQAEASRIVVAAHRVRRGGLPELRTTEGDFFFISRDEPEAVLSTIKHLVGDRVPRSFGLDPRADIQVLTPMRRGLLGATRLNAELQALLNPAGETVSGGPRLLRAGDRVMQIRNNYGLEVWNGDVGRLESFDPIGRRAWVDFEGRRVPYQVHELDQLQLAYACSIHKAQGSEYPCVLLPFHTQHYAMLQRNLLYTALTRGRRLVIVVGSRRALAVAVANDGSLERHTLLAERLRRR